MENKFDQGPATTVPSLDLTTNGSVRIIDAMVQEPSTAATTAEEKDTAQYRQFKAFAVVYRKGEEVVVKTTIENNGSVWTKYGYSAEADPRCGEEEEKCGNDMIIKLGGKVLGAAKNVEGAPEKTSKFDVVVSSKELDAIAEKNGIHEGETIKGDATLRYQQWSSLKSGDVHIETHEVETQETTTTAEESTTTTSQPTTSTTETVMSTTTAPHHRETSTSISVPGNHTELAYTGANTDIIAGSGALLLTAGLVLSGIGKRMRLARG